MPKKRAIDTHFWNDTYTGELEPLHKLLYIYLISSPLTNMLGVYEIQLRRICFDTSLKLETVRKALRGFERHGKVKYEEGYIILANFTKNQSYNRNMLKSAISEIRDIPEGIKGMDIFQKISNDLVEQAEEGGYKDLVREVKRLSEADPVSDKGMQLDLEDETSISQTFMGCPIPESLRIEGFTDRLQAYWDYMQQTRRTTPSIPAIEANFRRLLELKQQGNDPLKVIDQTINAGNKSFYPLKDEQFKNNGTDKNRENDTREPETETTYENDLIGN